MRLLTASLAAAALAGCAAPADRARDPTFLFAGELMSIDDQPSNASIGIEIRARPGSAQPAAYIVTSGCRLGGVSMDGKRFDGGERLSRCSQVEVETLARLEGLLSGPSTLTLSAHKAEFATPGGLIRFARTA
ncbi:MAG: hypothetical protein REJ23_02360 [Brevundimonas sp.]|nr:hypothetical protein [Brevundimonas sp.]